MLFETPVLLPNLLVHLWCGSKTQLHCSVQIVHCISFNQFECINLKNANVFHCQESLDFPDSTFFICHFMCSNYLKICCNLNMQNVVHA